MKVHVSVIGKRWDFECPHVSQSNLANVAEALRAQGHEINYWHWDSDIPKDGAFLVKPGFNLPGGKYVLKTKLLASIAKAEGRKLILFTEDIETLQQWWKNFDPPGNHGLVTTFRRPWRYWKAVYDFHQNTTNYPLHLIRQDLGVERPKFQLGYVGWPKPKRFRVLKSLGYPNIVMMGFGAHKQDHFPFCMADQNTPFTHLKELYSRAAWHLCVSDKEINWVQPCVSRHLEAWACDKPCVFHKSFLEAAPWVDWSQISDWVFDNSADLHRIIKTGMLADGSYDVNVLSRIAAQQRMAIQPQMMHDAPQVDRIHAYLEGLPIPRNLSLKEIEEERLRQLYLQGVEVE